MKLTDERKKWVVSGVELILKLCEWTSPRGALSGSTRQGRVASCHSSIAPPTYTDLYLVIQQTAILVAFSTLEVVDKI